MTVGFCTSSSDLDIAVIKLLNQELHPQEKAGCNYFKIKKTVTLKQRLVSVDINSSVVQKEEVVKIAPGRIVLQKSPYQ